MANNNNNSLACFGLSALAIAVGMASSSAEAATYTVDTLSTVSSSGTLTLYQAIANANNNPGPDTVDFAPGLTGTINMAYAAISITDALTIQGPGSDKLILSGGGLSNVVMVDAPPYGGNFQFSGLTIENVGSNGIQVTGDDNNVRVSDVVVKSTPQNGIAINGSNNTLYLSNTVISGASRDGVYISGKAANVFVYGSTISKNGYSGVSIQGDSASESLLYVNYSEITGNGPNANWGGGVDAKDTKVSVSGSRITNNKANYAGGGINIYGVGDLAINSTVISGNSADHAFVGASAIYGGGGAIYAGRNDGSEISVSIYKSELANNSAVGKGGAMVGHNASISLHASIVSGNSVSPAGTADGKPAFAVGGGLFVEGTTGYAHLNTNYSDISDNVAGTGAGAIASKNTFVSIHTSQVSGNSAGGNTNPYNSGVVGGAFLVDADLADPSGISYLRIVDSSVSGNRALKGAAITGSPTVLVGSGGAIGVLGDKASATPVYITVVDSTLSGNSAAGQGGGVAASLNNTANSRITVQQSTVTGNTAAKNAAIRIQGGSVYLTVEESTIFDNSASITGSDSSFAQVSLYGGSAEVMDTVIYGANGANPDLGVFTYAQQPSAIYSFIGSMAAEGLTFTASSSAPSNTSPKLGSLVRAGGFTDVRIPLADSPLIDAGKVSGTIDQRHMPRQAGAGQDIGAVEVSATAPPVANVDQLKKRLSLKPGSTITSLDSRTFFSDPDGGSIDNVQFTGLPSGLSVDSSGVISGTLSQKGHFFVTAVATDSSGEMTAYQFVASVEPPTKSSGGGGSIGLAWLAVLTLAGMRQKSHR